MTNKELILDCLADGGEAETQIKQFFDFLGKKIDAREIRNLIQEMLREELIYTDKKWKNEFGESPYLMTEKGKKVWNKKDK